MQEFPLHMFYYQRAYDYQSIMIRWMHMLPNNEPNNWQVANLDWHKSQQDVGVLHQYITLATTNHHHHRMDGPGPKSTCRNTRVQMTRLVLNHSMNMNIFYNNGEKYIDYIYIHIYLNLHLLGGFPSFPRLLWGSERAGVRIAPTFCLFPQLGIYLMSYCTLWPLRAFLREHKPRNFLHPLCAPLKHCTAED